MGHESPEAWKEARMDALAENLETFGTYSMLLQRALGSEGASFYALWRGTPSGFTSTIEPKSVYDQRDKWTGNTIFGPNGSFGMVRPNVTVPKPLETEYACWACKGTGWGVSQRGLHSNGEAITQKDVMNRAAAPLSTHVGRLFLVGSDYSVESGWAEGAMASSACALWHARGVPVYDQAEWARRDYCDLGSRAFLV